LRAVAPHAKPGEPLATAARLATAVPLGPALEGRDSAAAGTGLAREGRPASRPSALHAKPGEPLGAARRDSAVPFGLALERRNSTAA
jgi:hypothetical protein